MKKTIEVQFSRNNQDIKFFIDIYNSNLSNLPSPPCTLIYVGGVVYDKLLADDAKNYGYQLICPRLRYWQGQDAKSMGYEKIEQVTIDSLLDDLLTAINTCIEKRIFSAESGYVAVGGSTLGWLALHLANKDTRCIAVNLIATPVPAADEKSREAVKKSIEDYLFCNDLPLESEAKLHDQNLNKFLSKRSPGKRALLNQEALKATQTSKAPLTSKQIITNYRTTHNSLFWQFVPCKDEKFWSDCEVDVTFFSRFFNLMSIAPTLPRKEILIICGMHDFTVSWKEWLNHISALGFKSLSPTTGSSIPDKKQGQKLASTMGFVHPDGPQEIHFMITNAGHIPLVAQENSEFYNTKSVGLFPAPKKLKSDKIQISESSPESQSQLPDSKSYPRFIPNPELAGVYQQWLAHLKEHNGSKQQTQHLRSPTNG